jgi:hypothetical protein
MKKRRRWKFSQGGAAVFLLFLLAPFTVGFLRLWPVHGASRWWEWPLLLVLTLFFIALLWFLSLRPLILQQLWKIPRTWYEGCFGIAFLLVYYAIFVFVTGYTPSKHNPIAVPRSAGLSFLGRALVPLAIGGAFYVYDKYKGKRQQ